METTFLKVTYTITFAFLYCFVGCRNELPVSVVQPTMYMYRIHLFTIVNADTLFADSAEVTVDSKEVGFTDAQGMIAVMVAQRGIHGIAVKHKFFADFYGSFASNETPDIYIPLGQLVQAYHLHFFGIAERDTLLADSAYVSLDDGPPARADRDGIFTILPNSKGLHNIKVNHKLFSTYQAFIELGDHWEVYVLLNFNAKDFFPLRVGATWMYSFQYTPNFGPPLNWGTITWTILCRTQSFSQTTFTVFEHSKSISNVDTAVYEDSLTFCITESREHRITVEVPASLLYGSSSFSYQLGQILNPIDFRRYQPADNLDSLNVNFTVYGYDFYSESNQATIRNGLGCTSARRVVAPKGWKDVYNYELDRFVQQ